VEPYCDDEVSGVVCNIDTPRMIEGYLDLLQPEISPTFVVAPEYRSYFAAASFQGLRIVQLGLSKAAYCELKQLIRVLQRLIARNYASMSWLGWDMLRFANQLVHGRIRAPSGENYHLLTCEHHDLTKTIRNEFVKKNGGKSILFPYSSLYVLRFYPDEYYENYDFVLSPGKHYEDTLRENESTCALVFPVGTFAIHKDKLKGKDRFGEQRLRTLRSFVGKDRAVTILCPGVCKPTYTSEVKLMRLALALSAVPGVKVIIRQKPFVPEERYQGFYQGYVEGNPDILLTGMEYELFDFLPVTDLFITTYSTSACELSVLGGNVMFVDYLKQDDRFIFWRKEIVGSLLVSHEDAIDRIRHVLNTIDDDECDYRRDMETFSDYIGYRFRNYDAYRANLIKVLECEVKVPIRGSYTRPE
jgi:hypothetical protein